MVSGGWSGHGGQKKRLGQRAGRLFCPSWPDILLIYYWSYYWTNDCLWGFALWGLRGFALWGLTALQITCFKC